MATRRKPQLDQTFDNTRYRVYGKKPPFIVAVGDHDIDDPDADLYEFTGDVTADVCVAQARAQHNADKSG